MAFVAACRAPADGTRAPAPPAVTGLPAAARAPAPVPHAAEPPWGRLEVRQVLLEPPRDWLSPALCSGAPTVWSFPGTESVAVDVLLQEAGLDDATRAALRPHQQCTPGVGCLIRPPDELVVGLPPNARRALYATLSIWPENANQRRMIRIDKDHVHLWLDDTGLPPRLQEMAKRLTYREGGDYLLADFRLLCGHATTDDERVALLATFWRVVGRMVWIRVAPDSDVSALAAYWAPPVRRKSVRTMLESLRAVEGDTLVDLAQVLPPVARRLLNTFPTDEASGLDCQWTARHFFSDHADDAPPDPAEIQAFFEGSTDLVPSDQGRFGDILSFATSEGIELHHAIYLAEDLVFTKNGRTRFQPWHISTMAEIRAWYPAATRLLVRRVRPADLH